MAYTLSKEELSALDTALNEVKSRGLAVEEVTAGDFPLGGLEKVVAG